MVSPRPNQAGWEAAEAALKQIHRFVDWYTQCIHCALGHTTPSIFLPCLLMNNSHYRAVQGEERDNNTCSVEDEKTNRSMGLELFTCLFACRRSLHEPFLIPALKRFAYGPRHHWSGSAPSERKAAVPLTETSTLPRAYYYIQLAFLICMPCGAFQLSIYTTSVLSGIKTCEHARLLSAFVNWLWHLRPYMNTLYVCVIVGPDIIQLRGVTSVTADSDPITGRFVAFHWHSDVISSY